MKFRLAGLGIITFWASSALAENVSTCPPPAAFKAWASPSSVALVPGRSKDLSLKLTTRLNRAPGKLPKAGTYGGMVPFIVPKPGPYLIALDVPAWIDVVQSGTVVASIDHARAEQCTGIHKIVRFPLSVGRHVIQISGSPSAKARIMIVPAD